MSPMMNASLHRALLTLTLVLAGTLLSTTALANQDLANAERQLQEADFEAAVSSATTSIESGELTRDQMANAYWVRAAAQLANLEEGQAREDVRRVLALNPEFVPSNAEAFPELVSILGQLKTSPMPTPELTVEANARPGSLRLRPLLRGGSAGGLPIAYRVMTRVGSNGEWTTHNDNIVELEVPEGGAVDYGAQAVTNGVVVAQLGSARTPERVTVAPAATRSNARPDVSPRATAQATDIERPRGTGAPSGATEGDDDDDNTGLYIGIGVGVAVAIGAVVAIVLITGASAESSNVQAPTWSLTGN